MSFEFVIRLRNWSLSAWYWINRSSELTVAQLPLHARLSLDKARNHNFAERVSTNSIRGHINGIPNKEQVMFLAEKSWSEYPPFLLWQTLLYRYVGLRFNASCELFSWIPLSRADEQLQELCGIKVIHYLRPSASQAKEICSTFSRHFRWGCPKDAIIQISVNGVSIGQFIVDGYISAHKARLNSKSLFLWLRVYIGIRYHIVMRDFLKAHSPLGLVMAGAAELDGVALQTTHSLGALALLKKHEEFPGIAQGPYSLYSAQKFRNYPATFRELPKQQQEDGLRQGVTLLHQRVSGEDQNPMFLANNDGFRPRSWDSTNLSIRPEVPTVVLAMPNLFDTPNAYGRFPYVDYVSWIETTFAKLSCLEINLVLKRHPHVHSRRREAQTTRLINAVKKRYPAIQHLDSNVSWHSLHKDLNLSLVISAHGSVAHELPALGIPVATIGIHPAMAYGFCHSHDCVESYESFLENPRSWPIKIDEQALGEFYFMHYARPLALLDPFVYSSYSAYSRESWDCFREFEQREVAIVNKVATNLDEFFRCRS